MGEEEALEEELVSAEEPGSAEVGAPPRCEVEWAVTSPMEGGRASDCDPALEIGGEAALDTPVGEGWEAAAPFKP